MKWAVVNKGLGGGEEGGEERRDKQLRMSKEAIGKYYFIRLFKVSVCVFKMELCNIT